MPRASKYVEGTGNTTDEIVAATNNMLDQVDAIFTPTDNRVMDAELTIAESLIQAGVPHYTGADSFVRNGAFATCGVNYTELGAYTADMVADAMASGESACLPCDGRRHHHRQHRDRRGPGRRLQRVQDHGR